MTLRTSNTDAIMRREPTDNHAQRTKRKSAA